MKVYTKTGDKGATGLFSGGRVPKDHPIMECMGQIDELCSRLGSARSIVDKTHFIQADFHRIQTDLMNMMSHIATKRGAPKFPGVPEPKEGAEWMETEMDRLEAEVKTASDYFILPGGNELSSRLHLCRTQARTAERRLITLMNHEDSTVDPYMVKYINRLSDYCFILCRWVLDQAGIEEDRWNLFIYKPKKD
ncbi:MAG: cob(I)alamin adenosyltransferase [Sphingobacteriales bacterium]|jgi:cob(I)alamin adenosyltransferase